MKFDEFKSAVLEVCPKAIFGEMEGGYIFVYSSESERNSGNGFASLEFRDGGEGLADVFLNTGDWSYEDTHDLSVLKERLARVELTPSKWF